MLQFQQGHISLAPPQIYEMGRLMNFSELNDLESHAKERAAWGCQRWMPVRVKYEDGVASILPGMVIQEKKRGCKASVASPLVLSG